MRSISNDAVGVKRSRRRGAARLTILLTVAMSLSIGTGILTTPAQAETRAQTFDQVTQAEKAQASVPSSVTRPVGLADAALIRAKLQVAKGQLAKASTSLQTVRVKIRKAHKAAMNLIGKPPTDPESDDPPGPPAVMRVLSLEHRVGLGVVPLFDRQTETTFVQALRYTLYVTHMNRDKMLSRVIGLNREGAGADFEDGMADTLGGYTSEVNQIATGLDQYLLSTSGRAGLGNALSRARATEAKVNAAYGGGE